MKRIMPCSIGPSLHCVPVSSTVHQLAESLGNAIDAKDHNTHYHSEEVAVISQLIASALKLSPQTIDTVHVAGHLHDIGKIGIPDAVLKKPGPLNREEWEVIKTHPVVGAEILAPVKALGDSGIIGMVRHHHERFDGRGYPDGLAGDNIPLGARIIAVADSLSAMLQDRPYRSGRSFEEAVQELQEGAGSAYDPRIVKAFGQAQVIIAHWLQSLQPVAGAAAI